MRWDRVYNSSVFRHKQSFALNKDDCPNKCWDTYFTILDERDDKRLKSKKFKCYNDACNHGDCEDDRYGMDYDEACDHSRNCQHNAVKCPNGCRENIAYGELDDHLEVCEYEEITCNNCNVTYQRLEAGSHNCF